MIFIITPILILIICIILGAIYGEGIDKILASSLLLSFVAEIILLICMFVTMYQLQTEYQLSETKSLNAMVYQSETAYSGSFFLFSGSFGSKTSQEYVYMYEDELGFSINTRDVKYAKIVFSNEMPVVNIYESVYTEDSLLSKLFGIDKGDNSFQNDMYQFVIPEDSFQTIYDINLVKGE